MASLCSDTSPEMSPFMIHQSPHRQLCDVHQTRPHSDAAAVVISNASGIIQSVFVHPFVVCSFVSLLAPKPWSTYRFLKNNASLCTDPFPRYVSPTIDTRRVAWKYSKLVPTHIHTQPFYGLGFCAGLPEWASTRKVKPIWIYWSKSEWQWYQLGYTQICTLTQTMRASHCSVLQAGCPSCHPTASKYWRHISWYPVLSKLISYIPEDWRLFVDFV